MTNSRTTKKALLSSALALTLCVAMLIATTFAWFTDTASTSVNTIQAGTLDVGLQMSIDGETWTDAEGTTLSFQKAATAPAGEEVLWEPGCTYELPQLRVVNNGKLAFKYKIAITGATGNTELLDVIEFTTKFNGTEIELDSWEGMLIPTGKTPTAGTSEEAGNSSSIVISGHMDESAGNEYQDLSLEGISITVYATQYTYEYDSYNNTYDESAESVVTSSPFNDYVKVTGTKSTSGATTLKDNAGTLIATLPENSLANDVSSIALIKEPADNPSSVEVKTGESALTTDVKIIDTATKEVISATGGKYFTISIQLGQVDLQKFYHKGEELEYVESDNEFTKAGQYKYDFATGVVTFTTDSFSTFTAVFKYSGGDGTETHPYLLSTAKDLSGLAGNKEDATGRKYFELLNNIELPDSWTAINSFSGTINGNEKTIKFTGEQGLFTYLNSGSTIKNLKLESYTAKNALLAYLTYCSALNPTTISDVTIDGSVSYVAAMIGWLCTEGSGAAETTEALIKNCTNNASVNGDGDNRAVGLVGTVKTLNVEFNGCVNNGALTVTNTDEAHAAGIAGYVMKMNKNTDTSVVKIIDCRNTGAISATSTSDGRANVGGIISTAHQGTFTITGCTNTGNITGTDSANTKQACVGGIVGRANVKPTLSNCSNSGNITAIASGNGKKYAGAMVGYGSADTESGCTNRGTIDPQPQVES